MAEQFFDPPDPELIGLAKTINNKARAGKVSFFSRGGVVSVIFANGSRRRVIALDGRPTDGDVDAMVSALESWSGFQDQGSAYSTEIPPLPESGW